MMIAEESSAGQKITGPEEEGGLGFDYKWNMGWMNDILRFYEEDPVYRKFDFNLVTFCLLYTSDAADDLLCVDLDGRRLITENTINNNGKSTKQPKNKHECMKQD